MDVDAEMKAVRELARLCAIRGLAEVIACSTALDDAPLPDEVAVERMLLDGAPTDAIAHLQGLPLYRLAAIYAHILQRNLSLA